MNNYEEEFKAVYNLFHEIYTDEEEIMKKTQDWMSEQKYAWYSRTQHQDMKERKDKGFFKYTNGVYVEKKPNWDCHIYLNLKGEKIICTSVNHSPTKIVSEYDDFVCLGKVVRWVGNSIEDYQYYYEARGSGVKAAQSLKSKYVYKES